MAKYYYYSILGFYKYARKSLLKERMLTAPRIKTGRSFQSLIKQCNLSFYQQQLLQKTVLNYSSVYF